MKVIDLLVKIANGEEVSKKIKFMNSIWEYCKNGGIQDYINDYDKCLMEFIPINKVGLNDEVEIIEEPKKIEYEQIEELTCNEYDFETKTINSLIKNQRKLIDEINNLKEKKDE